MANKLDIVLFIRAIVIAFSVFCVFKGDSVQVILDNLYGWLLTTWIFNSVYFETLWTMFCYAMILNIPKLIDSIPYLDKYKIDPKIHWESRPWTNHIAEAAIYGAPFAFLDTFLVKKYVGVNSDEWVERRASIIQHTRALPEVAPSIGQIVVHLIGTFIIYDGLFFLVHIACHKNMFLYKHIHAFHHEHEMLTSRVSNQMTVTERIGLVLAANESLKIMGSHPLTRTVFVPILLYWLMENHLGYKLPWGLDKIAPYGLIGGSEKHYKHHLRGHQHYEPFFTYIDDWIYPMAKTYFKVSNTVM